MNLFSALLGNMDQSYHNHKLTGSNKLESFMSRLQLAILVLGRPCLFPSTWPNKAAGVKFPVLENRRWHREQ